MHPVYTVNKAVPTGLHFPPSVCKNVIPRQDSLPTKELDDTQRYSFGDKQTWNKPTRVTWDLSQKDVKEVLRDSERQTSFRLTYYYR